MASYWKHDPEKKGERHPSEQKKAKGGRERGGTIEWQDLPNSPSTISVLSTKQGYVYRIGKVRGGLCRNR